MGSAEGFGGVVVTEVGRMSGGACSSRIQKDIQVDDMSVPASWGKIPMSELCREASQPRSLHNKDVAKNSGLENRTSPSLALDVGDKPLIGRTGEIPRSNSLCSKRSGTVQMEVSDCKSGLRDAEGMSLELVSYPASSNILEKTQMVKQRKSSLIKNGDKRNEKIQVAKQRKTSLMKRADKKNGKMHKNRCDSISLKNGLVSFNSAAGGNNFFGIYGLKADVFDITKYCNEIPLDEILHGKYHCPSIAKDKGKKAVNSNSSLLQSVRKAFSVLQARKDLQAEKCAEIDHSCNQKVSTSLVSASSSTSQSDSDKGECCDADLPSSDKVQESVGKMIITTMSDCPLYQPKEIWERLALSPPKDLESFLFDVARPASSFLKQGNEPRMGKSVSHRAGLPPFPWSNSYSGHNKSGVDATKLSANRTICQGRWLKVRSSAALQRCCSDSQMDLESLTFDHSLVPSVNAKAEHAEHHIAPTEKLLPSSEACLTSKIPAADEHSPVYAAAQALCQLAIHSSKKNPHSTIKLLGKSSQITMKPCKSKAIERSDKFSDPPKSGTTNLIKLADEGFPSKKLKLTTDVRNTYISRTDSQKRQAFNWSTPEPVRSPPMKLFSESKPEIDRYNINLVKKPYMMKPPRGADRPGIGQQKFRKVVPAKWNRPEG
ncbi:hypothetical protein F511_39597 [Dorcoceras hygrometricum]|uniref:Uncharacterized protein n=1 Tax=Dorcoceras hygrometricum TaxID=472368 RepID=A0A2Z7AIJ4_9LAMI|nr:hypothetical protein F511_39597 [Dorcoceras hygrometricum]